MQEKEEKTDREQVMDMIGDMGVRVREDEEVDLVRMRKKEGDGLARPIIVEFKSEYDKWTVLSNKFAGNKCVYSINVYNNNYLIEYIINEYKHVSSHINISISQLQTK